MHLTFFSTGRPKKGIDKKLSVWPVHCLNWQFFEFIWIQHVCKFCLVYHLIDLDASRWSHNSFSETCAIFKCANSVEKQLLNFWNASVLHCFRNSSLTIIWNNLGLSNYKHMKRNLEFRKRNTCYNSKGESSCSDAFVESPKHSIVLGRIFCWAFIKRCFLK